MWRIGKVVRNGKTYWQASNEGLASPSFCSRSSVVDWCRRIGIAVSPERAPTTYGPGQYVPETGTYNGFTS